MSRTIRVVLQPDTPVFFSEPGYKQVMYPRDKNKPDAVTSGILEAEPVGYPNPDGLEPLLISTTDAVALGSPYRLIWIDNERYVQPSNTVPETGEATAGQDPGPGEGEQDPQDSSPGEN